MNRRGVKQDRKLASMLWRTCVVCSGRASFVRSFDAAGLRVEHVNVIRCLSAPYAQSSYRCFTFLIRYWLHSTSFVTPFSDRAGTNAHLHAHKLSHSLTHSRTVCLLNLLHLIPTTHKDSTPVMNVFRNHLHHPPHLAVHCLSARVLHHHRHRCTFIENSQLAFGGLAIGRVSEDTSVEERAVCVCDLCS